MFRYRLFDDAGNELGEASYPVMIQAGEIIWTAAGRVRVVEVVPIDEEESPFAGLLRLVAAA